MQFNNHSRLEGMHSFLSPSQSAWLNYTDEQFDERWRTARAAAHGTRLHDFAKTAIELGQKMPDTLTTMNMYINDAIGFGMTPEQTLFYSVNAFGTADCIKYDHRKKELRVHDLKTGTSKATMRQLECYVGLFCLEYDIRPAELESIVLRIYQNDEIIEHIPELDDIVRIIATIVDRDKRVELLKAEAIK